jgi:reactive chlorine resistance protein C
LHEFKNCGTPAGLEQRSKEMLETKAIESTDTLNPQPASLLTPTETNIWAVRIARIDQIGHAFLRYGLVVAIGWIAAMKATEYEAKGIQPLIAHSPFLSWGYSVWSVNHFTMIIGAGEITIATLIALRRWFPRASAFGSLGAVLMFLTTLSFIITTPGWEPSLGGFPALSGDVGEFLIKDLVLFGAALWTLTDSLKAVSSRPTRLHN